MSPIRVLLADDHALFRSGVAAVLGASKTFDVVGQAADGLEAVEKALQLKPDVIVMDLHMPRCTGVEATQRLQQALPSAKVLMLTVSEREADLFSAIKAGARGYVLKNFQPEDLVQAVEVVAKGEAIIAPLMASKLLLEFRGGAEAREEAAEEARELLEAGDALSAREREVLQCVARGLSNKEVADALYVSVNTVKTHLKNILEKLHLKNRSQAAAYAIRTGLADADRGEG
ncbi:MAG: response regulator transcription factor [Chloroflexi bacterium]|nr:response regulator transcription factor [Chloroflexota bacterium]